MGLDSCSSRATRSHVPHPSRTFQALIKIYSLVDCPIYSVVKYRPRETVVGRSSLAVGQKPRQPRFTTRLSGLGLANSQKLRANSCLSNPMFGAKRLSLTGIRNSVVVLAPNVGLVVSLRSSVLSKTQILLTTEGRRLKTESWWS
jgi:hypothetical protein